MDRKAVTSISCGLSDPLFCSLVYTFTERSPPKSSTPLVKYLGELTHNHYIPSWVWDPLIQHVGQSKIFCFVVGMFFTSDLVCPYFRLALLEMSEKAIKSNVKMKTLELRTQKNFILTHISWSVGFNILNASPCLHLYFWQATNAESSKSSHMEYGHISILEWPQLAFGTKHGKHDWTIKQFSSVVWWGRGGVNQMIERQFIISWNLSCNSQSGLIDKPEQLHFPFSTSDVDY